jgi:hypothetical protein
MGAKPSSPLLPYLDEVAERRAKGETWRAIAKALTAATGLEVKSLALRMLFDYHGGRTPEPESASEPMRRRAAAPMRDVHDFVDLPPRPFAVPVPRPASAAVLRGWRRTLVYGDSHVPHHSDGALALVQRMLLESEAECILNIGDLLDCYTISRYSKDPNRLYTLQDEIDLARVHLHQMAQLAPRAERWLLEGNHEARLRKLIWDLPGAAQELARLRTVQQATEWPVLLGLDEIGWQWVPTHEQTRTTILPKLITKHGTVVRKWSGWTAKGEWERYGKGGLSGHTHRLGKFYHRDHNGAHLWVESGCTCDLNPEYMLDPDWQNGCLIVTHTPDADRYSVEEVYMQDGEAIWRGNLYQATA